MILPVSPKHFLQKEQVTLYMTPYILSLLKGFISNFDYSKIDLVNITPKTYLLATCLSCFKLHLRYSFFIWYKNFQVWLFFDLVLDVNVCLIVFCY